MASRGVAWYVKRLRVMRPAEVLHRVGEQFTIRRLRATHEQFEPARAASLGFCTATARQLPDLPLNDGAIFAQQDDLLAGRWPALGFDWQWQPGAVCWRIAPDSGREWPATFFASIAYRPGNPCGDVRVAWEPARLQQLVSLAVLARRGDADVAARAVRLIEDELLSFTEANPPWAGIHYLSAMECGLRLLAVVHAIDMVRDRLERGAEVWSAVARLVSSHAPFIAARLSLHSSSGNHTIAECAALVYAGHLFPELPGASQWRERGLEILVAEMDRQVLPDGGSIEQAFWYLLLLADLAGLVVALLDHRNQPVPAPLREVLARARRFIAEFATCPEELPAVGDGDDGFALSPVLRLSFPAARARGAGETFAHSGYSTARLPAGPDYEVLFDHGPLGMAPLFGHAHADALSVTLRIAGRDVLIDPGTYSYGGDLRWRAYFRSTAAHNTVTVDGLDQAQYETPFIWWRPYRCELVRCERSDDAFRALARHDGYSRLSRKVVHWRGVVLRSGCGLLIWDRLDGEGEHDIELRWHTKGSVTASGGGWRLGEDTVMEIGNNGSSGVLHASEEPPGGWWSPRYGVREPARTIRAAVSGPLPVEFTTRVSPRGTNLSLSQLSEELELLRTWVRPR